MDRGSYSQVEEGTGDRREDSDVPAVCQESIPELFEEPEKDEGRDKEDPQKDAQICQKEHPAAGRTAGRSHSGSIIRKQMEPALPEQIEDKRFFQDARPAGARRRTPQETSSSETEGAQSD